MSDNQEADMYSRGLEKAQKEIEELKNLIQKNREALAYYANRMGSGGTARRAIEEIDKGLEKAEKIKA